MENPAVLEAAPQDVPASDVMEDVAPAQEQESESAKKSAQKRATSGSMAILVPTG